MSYTDSIKTQMNEWSAAGIPFLFLIDFEMGKPLIFRLSEIDPHKLLYTFNGITNCNCIPASVQHFRMVKQPESFKEYLVKFNKVKEEIAHGNSYLLNLTCSTPIHLNLTLREMFLMSSSRYKIWWDDRFICFSPETFVTIRDGVIRSFPMKGTIDAALPDAEHAVLNDPKEKAEHYTIVDLIRNDLSLVADRVRVARFRYIDIIETSEKKLLQVSSEICGELKGDTSRIGDIIHALLPAGSVSGAPKQKTAEIIASVENRERGYYTGIAGLFDGTGLDSCVMIRFIEKGNGGYYYRSGGGITSFSDPESEYREMIDKIYVPVV